jgi:hypothetical protein
LKEEPPQEEPEEEEEEEKKMEEEVSLEVLSMNQFDTSEEKLYARRACGYLFSDDSNTPSTFLDTPPTLESHRCSDEESSDDNDDNGFWM